MDWFISNNSYINKRKRKIFVFPYAGGGAYSFRNWQEYFPNFEIITAQYPGRENRIIEKPVSEFKKILDGLYEELIEQIDEETDYYLFGHSLGTKYVYELVLKIMNSKNKNPKGIIISAGKAPCYKEKNPIHQLDDNNFIKEISRFSVTPTKIIENIEIMKVFLPMLRADFSVDETYINNDIVKIDVPILGLMGTEDEELMLSELTKWQEYTNKNFSYSSISGGHMFINKNLEDVIIEIKKFIEICDG